MKRNVLTLNISAPYRALITHEKALLSVKLILMVAHMINMLQLSGPHRARVGWWLRSYEGGCKEMGMDVPAEV